MSRREGSVPAITLVRVLLLFEASLYAAVTPVLPHYAQTLGASKPAVGLLAAAYSAGVIPGSLLGGWLAARVGVRRTTLVGPDRVRGRRGAPLGSRPISSRSTSCAWSRASPVDLSGPVP